MFECDLKAHRSVAFFHDVGERVTHDIGLLTVFGKAHDLRRIKSVRCGNSTATIDHTARLVEIIGSHRDPLYIVQDNDRHFVEIGLYDLSGKDREVMIEMHDGSRHAMAIDAPCDFSVFQDTPLTSSAMPRSDGSQLLWTLSHQDIEVVEQRMVGFRFVEKRTVYPAGRHLIAYELDPALAYFGVSINARMPTGHDYEHKHVFHGRL